MKITYQQLNGALLPMTVARLCQEGRFSPKIAFSLVKINKALNKETETARELFRGIIKQHCVLNEVGEPKPFPEENLAYKPEEGKKEAMDKAITEFLALEFDIPVTPIPVDQIDAGCRFSPQEVEALSPILDMSALDA